MKGRTRCPDCKHEFVLDIPTDKKKYEAICPNCESKFTIKTKEQQECDKNGCFWEEYGEPRKTILSSIKPKTNKPKIAAIILVCVLAIGITTAALSESFIITSLGVASSIGLEGDVEIKIIDDYNKSLSNFNVSIDGKQLPKQENGVYLIDAEPGLVMIEISRVNYTTIKKEILVTPFIVSSHELKMKKGSNTEVNNFDEMSCTIILLIFSVFALLGAIACLKRKHFDIAVAGCIISIFTFGFFLVGSILSIIAFVIVMKSKEEFEDGKKGKIF